MPPGSQPPGVASIIGHRAGCAFPDDYAAYRRCKHVVAAENDLAASKMGHFRVLQLWRRISAIRPSTKGPKALRVRRVEDRRRCRLTRSRERQPPEHRDLGEVEQNRERGRGRDHRRDRGERQRRHRHPRRGQDAGERQCRPPRSRPTRSWGAKTRVEGARDCCRSSPGCRRRSSGTPAFAGSRWSQRTTKWPTARYRERKYQLPRAHEHARRRQPADAPRLGCADGRTLSVASDMPSASPTIMISAISNGVSTACPVMMRPAAMNRTWTIFLVIEFSV